jgi:acyl-CoA thioester hydrolase
MSRVKLDLPEKFNFSTEISVRITDLNYGGHLGNDSLLSIIHEARVRFLTDLKYKESDIAGTATIMSDAVIIYKSEVFYGDKLIIEVAVEDLQKFSCDFIFKITNKKTGSEVARAKTGIVFYDYQKKKITRIPSEFLDAVSK